MTGSVGYFNKLLTNRPVDRHQLRAVGKSSFHLNLVHHFGDAVHDIFPLENRRAVLHEFRNGAAIADSFEEFGRNERDSLRVIQPQSARASLAGQFRGAGNQQLVNFPRCEVHVPFFKRRTIGRGLHLEPARILVLPRHFPPHDNEAVGDWPCKIQMHCIRGRSYALPGIAGK
jgi:hypothetical protein